MKPIIKACLGILYSKSDNTVLLASRPEGKPYAGYWEFPGGKLETGETSFEALSREFEEEIGVKVEVRDMVNLGGHRQVI